jgi:hypothetical protein
MLPESQSDFTSAAKSSAHIAGFLLYQDGLSLIVPAAN